MRAPIDGPLVITQGYASLRGGPSERYTAWRDGAEITCIGHPAYDISCATGTPVYAVKGGLVALYPGDRFLGNYLVITLRTGEEFTYAHLSAYRVADGALVAEGEQIGATGATGNVTGPHLHFAYRPAHPNYRNGFDGYEDAITHFDAAVYPLIDLHLV